MTHLGRPLTALTFCALEVEGIEGIARSVALIRRRKEHILYRTHSTHTKGPYPFSILGGFLVDLSILLSRLKPGARHQDKR